MAASLSADNTTGKNDGDNSGEKMNTEEVQETMSARGIVLRDALDAFVHKIVGAVSQKTFQKHFPKIHEKNKHFLHHTYMEFCQQFGDDVRDEIKLLYEEEKIFPLLKKLDDLASQSKSQESNIKWRPTGDPEQDILSHVSQVELDYKGQLEKLFKDLDMENDDLAEEVKRKRKKLELLREKLKEEVSCHENVVEGLSFLHQCETSILNRLCSLGTNYSFIKDFIQKNHIPSKGHGGLYIAALCRGLEAVLNDYTQQILLLEKECMKDPHLPLSHFQYKLDEYQMLFPALLSLIENINENQTHGCSILDVIFKYTSSGIPIAQKSFKKILAICHGVLYKQLTAWLLYGMLIDDYHEFFIHKISNDVTDGTLISELKLENPKIPKICETYDILANLLPSYIPLRVANRILFIGESVQLFSNKKDSNSLVPSESSIFDDQESTFCEQLFQLQQKEEFSLNKFEAILEDIRSYVAQHMWKLVVEESDLIGKLTQIKNYYLLARGELFLAFIDQVDTYLSMPPTSTTEHDVNTAFLVAARSIFVDEKSESEIAKFHFRITKNSKIKEKEDVTSVAKIDNGWSCLGLEYDVSWPLHILFTPHDISRVKRVQSELNKCWTLQMVNKQILFQHNSIWQLRNHMSFIIDNLQYYLQKVNFTSLLEKIKATRDFEQIQHAHEQFLTSIMMQTFLLHKQVSQCFTKMLDLCLQYCNLITQSPIEKLEN
ncbi:Gamma-tubulin complex component 4 [Nymphon striatum]|nr:Gamma-tubulin complex component 4 [Nymphon striatum]